MHPNELASAPRHMQLVRTIPVEEAGRTGTVYLFKFRIDPPHWAAKDGWLAYWKEGESPDEASGTFSELVPFDKLSEDEHVNLLKQALQKNGLVVRAGF